MVKISSQYLFIGFRILEISGRLKGFLLAVALSAGLGCVFPVSAQIYIVDLNSKTYTDLGTVTVSGINDAGQVVGWSVTAGGSAANAIITSPNGAGMRDLGSLGGCFSEATAINDAGQVVGWSNSISNSIMQ